MLSGKARGGMQQHAARPDEPERSYCGYLIPLGRSEVEGVTCKPCLEQLALIAGTV